MKSDANNLNCIICGSRDVYKRQLLSSSERAKGKILDIKICGACGHARLTKQPSEMDNLNFQMERYDKLSSKINYWKTRWPGRHGMTAASVNRLFKYGGTLLDIGCNNGELLIALGNNWKKHGIEISSKAAEIAAKYGGADVYCGTYDEYEIDDNYFDVITCCAVIEHICEINLFVDWIWKKLKQGGMLVMMTGDRESKLALKMDNDWPLYWCSEHIHFFSATSLNTLLKNHNYSIIQYEWRFQYGSSGRASMIRKLYERFKEIIGFINKPKYDHYYVYARKNRDDIESIL